MGPFAKNCGAIGQDASGFAVFPTYAKGMTALETLVTNAATGKSTIYRPEMSLYNSRYDPILYAKHPDKKEYWPGFFQLYAPAEDSNDPLSYAHEVARRRRVPASVQVQYLV